MNTVVTSVKIELVSGSTELNVSGALPLVASVKHSFAYRARLWMTAVSIGIGLVLAALNRPFASLSVPLDVGFDVLGWLVLSLGAAIRIWSSTYICARKSRDVVQTGPYSICRNPLYWGTFLMVAAFPLLLKSPILAACMLPPILLYLLAVVPAEESVMSRRHGAEYAAYCAAVPRWWPTLAGFVKGEPLDGQTIGYFRECSRLFWWVGLALGLDVAFHFANSSWWPHPLHWW